MHDTDQLLNRVLQRLDVIEGKVDTLMSAQSDVDAAVAALNEFLSDVAEQITADGTPVDTSALNAVIAQVPAVQEALDALAPATTTPAPAPSA
jgi:uncharacterized protein YoxC